MGDVAPRDGDGFVMCSCGNAHWGRFGAAGLLLVRVEWGDPRVLLQLRAEWTHDGGTWALPGGAVDSHEDPTGAAIREASEEAGIDITRADVKDLFMDDHGTWSYATVIAHADGDLAMGESNAETDDLRWVPVARVVDYRLHPGFASAWPDLLERVHASLS
jgi:8-oxo-dGTP diphosphatase